MIPPVGMKALLKNTFSLHRKTFTGRTIYIQEKERGYSIRNGFTLI